MMKMEKVATPVAANGLVASVRLGGDRRKIMAPTITIENTGEDRARRIAGLLQSVWHESRESGV